MNETAKLGARLPHRGALRIGGADRIAFLQGIVSNDVAKAVDGSAVYAALLTPQGKFLHDLFILADGDSFLMDCERDRAEDLLRRLTAYKLRAKVTLENLADAFDVWGIGGAYDAPLAYADPRLPALGSRAFIAKGATPANVQTVPFESYDLQRLRLGVADGSRDLEIEKSTLAEGNFGLLHGVDWKKGCYVGQELTARMHYRGLAKKCLFPVTLSALPPGGAKNLTFDGVEAGELRSACGAEALALLSIEAAKSAMAQNKPFKLGEIEVSPFRPDWLVLPESKS